jgi:hypothetical protein
VRANSSDTCTDGENGPNCFDLDTTGGTDPSPANFPISDAQITQMEGQADEDTTDCPSGCTVSSGSIGPMKYDGDVTINGTVTLAGTVWVKGNLTLSTGAVIRLSNSYGSNSGVIIADNPDNVATSGRIIAGNDSALARNSNADTYIMGIATSTSLDTNSPAFLANNNFSKASITPDAAAVMYVPHGMAKLQNNTELKEITAHSLYLSQNAFVVYETGLASVEFSSGPGGSWIYQKGSYQIIE